MLEIKLFGPGQMAFAGRPLLGFPNRQAYALLCYLLLNRGYPHSREKLAATFWGDSSTPLSRKYLRNALWQLRLALQAIGAPADDYVRIDEDSVAFLNSAHYRLDVETFETLAAHGQDRRGQDLNRDQAGQLELAVQTYTGDLLDGLDTEWCLYDRERLGLLYLNTLGKLLAYYGAHDQYERALAYGERILARDNTREKVHREIMRLHWLAGEPKLALAQYKRCEQILQEELGIAPLDETRRMYHQMLHDQFDPNANLPVSQSKAPCPDSAQALSVRVLNRIRHLQTTAETIRLELDGLEELLNRTLLDSA